MSNKSLLPVCMQDKNNLTLEKCIKTALSIDMKKLLFYPIQNVDENLLYQFSKENHVQGFEGWNLMSTKQEKQTLIENSLNMHSKKGSRPSVIEALSRINIEAKISEFWEYGGRPAHFIVEFLNIFDRGLTAELEQAIKEMILNYKPATRILDGINFFLCSTANLYTISTVKTSEEVSISTNGVIL